MAKKNFYYLPFNPVMPQAYSYSERKKSRELERKILDKTKTDLLKEKEDDVSFEDKSLKLSILK